MVNGEGLTDDRRLSTARNFACPDLTTFCRLDELGLVLTGQRLEPDPAVLGRRAPACLNDADVAAQSVDEVRQLWRGSQS